MRLLTLYLVAACLTTIITTPARADSYSESGNGFINWCSVVDKPDEQLNADDLEHVSACIGFVTGLLEGIAVDDIAYEGKCPIRPFSFCLPDPMPPKIQLIRVIMKYIRENPETAHETAAVLTIRALKHAYPCGKR
jgi:hypothetical protein